MLKHWCDYLGALERKLSKHMKNRNPTANRVHLLFSDLQKQLATETHLLLSCLHFVGSSEFCFHSGAILSFEIMPVSDN